MAGRVAIKPLQIYQYTLLLAYLGLCFKTKSGKQKQKKRAICTSSHTGKNRQKAHAIGPTMTMAISLHLESLRINPTNYLATGVVALTLLDLRKIRALEALVTKC